MEIRETSISFPVVRGSGPQRASSTVIFPRDVTKAVAAVRGYQIGFVGDDHHVGLLEVDLDTQVNANVVEVDGTLGCRDWSGSWDDEYNGSIQITVLAELEPVTAPPPRGDLQIVDVEYNQATQFFRSGEHLDANNVMPDNSMPLVGGKMTGLRFYVDYDASAGMPFTMLSGELVLRSGGTMTTPAPLAVITPSRVSEIDRAQVGHTLNFAIPAAWCRGRLEVSCQVFDAANPGQKSSTLRRTLDFLDVNPLRVYTVGINYTGMGLNLAPPTQANLQATLGFTRKVWPTGDVLASGFTTMAFSQNLAGVAANGCGSGFNALLDQLKDIKGDTDDLVYGLLPTGTPLTGVAGCGGGGVGAGTVFDGLTAAHEAAHAVGREHAPCDNTMRCDTPPNPDDDYPQYGNYVSDSIGEFGFDPQLNQVFDPAANRDFMGYSPSSWVSPYTYKALMAKGDPVGYSPGRGKKYATFASLAATAPDVTHGSSRAEWIRQRMPLLFLSIYVDRDKVILQPSFTYDAHLRRPGPNSDYEVHLEDANGDVLACVRLQLACAACDKHCGPQHLQGEVPWHDDAHRLVLRKGGEDIEAFDVECQPKIDVRTKTKKNGDLVVSWTSTGEAGPLWWLLQWQDRDGSWRGIAPRTQDDHMIVPKRYQWAAKNRLNLRVLAVYLLHTAAEEIKVNAQQTEPPTRIDVMQLRDGQGYRAVAIDPLGRQMPDDELVWYDEDGGEIARGGDLPLQRQKGGVATVRLLGQGIVATEGYALLNPVKDSDNCGSRAGGQAGLKALQIANLHSQEKDDE